MEMTEEHRKQNDEHALRLLKERYEKQAEYSLLCKAKLNEHTDKKLTEIGNRIEVIDHALKAWSVGENILTAILSYEREQIESLSGTPFLVSSGFAQAVKQIEADLAKDRFQQTLSALSKK